MKPILRRLAVLPAVLLLISLTAAPARAFCDDWTRSHTYQEIAFQTLLFVDTRLTIDGCERVFRDQPRCESNPVLKPRPSRGDMNATFVLVGASHFLISCFAPPQDRTGWEVITISLEGFAVLQWVIVGARLTF